MSRRAAAVRGRATWQHSVDAVVLTVLLGIGLLGLGPTFGNDPRYLVAGFGGVLLGLGLTWWAARRHWNAWTVAGALWGAYLTFGTVLAVPGESFLGFLPTVRSLRVLAAGVVVGWKDLLTVADPVGTGSGMLVVPLLCGLLGAAAAGSLAWRVRSPYWAAAPVLLVFVAGIVLGTNSVSLPAVRGTVLVAVLLAWLSYRRDLARTGSGVGAVVNPSLRDPASLRTDARRRVALGAGMLVAGAVLSLAVNSVLPVAADRAVLRDVVEPPVDLYAYPSPLASFRKYVKDTEDEVLFTVEGLPEGQRVRLAAMDAYDGVVYNVDPQAAGNFARVGDAQRLVDPATVQAGEGARARLRFTIEDYRGVWLPAAGELLSVALGGPRAKEMGRSFYYNDDARTALSTVGVQPGDSYDVEVLFPESVPDEQLAQFGFADLSLPRIQNDPPIIAGKANEYIGSVSEPLEKVRRLEQVLAAQGFFSSGKDDHAPSLPGHGAARMLGLLDAEQMVGDDEQYAVAMALMARTAGVPARVVMGFYPDWAEVKDPGAPVEITGGDVHAWVEVAFDRHGWVPFNPTPPEDNEPVPPQQKPKSSPKPQVLQPPPPPQEPADLPPESVPEPQDAQERDKDFWFDWGPLLLAVALALVPVGVLLGPLVLVAFLKGRRRKRRSWDGPPAQRVGGGWSEVLSLATDLGATVNPKATRRESAQQLGAVFPGSAGATATLAQRADRGIFAADDPTEQEVQSYWQQVHGTLEGMAGSVGFWKRQRARFSPRSLLLEGRAALAHRRGSENNRRPR